MTGHDLSATARSSDGASSQNVDRRAIEPPTTWYSGEQYSQQSNHSEYSQSSQSTQASQSQKVRKTGTGGGAWNAPIAHFMMTETSGQTYGFGQKTEEDRYCRLAEEARKWVLGPMPPQDFLDTFLKKDKKWASLGNMPASRDAFQAVPETARLEQAIYEPLARAMNQGRCPGFTFCITSEVADSSGPLGLTGSCKPDLCCYANEHLGKVKDYIKEKDKPKPKPKKRNKQKNDVGDSDSLGGDKGSAGGSRDEVDSKGADLDSGSSDADTVRQTSPSPHSKSKSDADSAATSSKQAVPMKYTHMGYAALVIEVKRHLLDDVFCDPMSEDDRAAFHFVTASENVKVLKRLGQQVAYASEMCKRQHRHFCFTISICSHYARFIRWDRAGAIVSERFSVRTQPGLLCDFLWRFACTSHAQRGYDLTVEPATEDQAKLFVSAIEAHVRSQGGPTEQPKYEAAVEEHYQEESVTVLHLLGSNADEMPAVGPYLLVSRPVVVPLSVAGRGTRTYWAVSPDTKDVWLLKDTWRYDAPGEPNASAREGDVLRAVGQITEHVPPVMYHEDVLRVVVENSDELSRPEDTDSLWVEHTFGDVQTTLTQDFLDPEKFSWACRANHTLDQLRRFIIKRTHYRLVLGAAGYPLLRFKDSNELLHATYDAFGALKAAFEIKKRLHRDVTPGNIILYNDPKQTGVHVTNSSDLQTPRKGYLIDWELSRECELDDSKSESFSVNVASAGESCAVSATWQFVSASIAMYVKRDGKPTRRHTIGDDIESMIYVVLYCALLWLPFEKPDPCSVKNVLRMFDWWTPWQDGVIRGGVFKHENLLEDQIYTSSLQWTVPTLQKWLSKALKRVKRGTSTSTSKGRTMEQGFYAWWGKFLVKHQGANHHAMRSDNTRVSVLQTVFKSKSAAVMEDVAHQSTISAPDSSSHRSIKKRLWKGDGLPPPDEAGPSSKRPRLGLSDVGPSDGAHLLPTSWRASDESIADTIQAASSWNSSRASSVLREIMETGGGVEGDIGVYESDYGSEADEGSAAEEGDDEAPMQVEVSASKGKARARGVKGWGPQ